jgi:hypothetical protein
MNIRECNFHKALPTVILTHANHGRALPLLDDRASTHINARVLDRTFYALLHSPLSIVQGTSCKAHLPLVIEGTIPYTNPPLHHSTIHHSHTSLLTPRLSPSIRHHEAHRRPHHRFSNPRHLSSLNPAKRCQLPRRPLSNRLHHRQRRPRVLRHRPVEGRQMYILCCWGCDAAP